MRTNFKNNLRITYGIIMIAALGWVFMRSDEGSEQKISAVEKVSRVFSLASTAPVKVDPQIHRKPELKDEFVLTPAVKEALQSFMVIKKKTFRTYDDDKKMASLINSSVFLDYLATIVLTPAPTISKSEFNAVVDLLLEALHRGDRQAAEQTILTIIASNQLDQANLKLSFRENLAGAKAELLFHGTSMDSRSIQNAIADTATQKIWDNVLAMQNENAAQSRNETQNYLAAQRDK